MNLNTLKLTTSQKQLLVRIFTSPTPELAKAETEFGEKNIAATEILKDLNLIEVDDETASVSSDGKEVMKKQGLLDDNDQLSSEAEQFKAGDNENETDDLGDDMGMGDQPDLGDDQPNDFGDEDFGGAFDEEPQGDDSMTADDDFDLPDPSVKESLIYNVNKLLKKG